jgi:cyclopropane fatty-acyl-phospholipid synthase-like methyltransferase
VTDARWRFTTIAHAGRSMLGPVSNASADVMLSRLDASAPMRVLDVGCGKGALLLRALERWDGTGIGIEPNPAFTAEARALAEQRLGPGRVRFIERDYQLELVEGERFPLVICTGALHAFGDGGTKAPGLKELLAPGGHALAGPGYWRQRPARDYLEITGISGTKMHPLDELIEGVEEVGWRVLAVHESTTAEWDDYEHAYAANVLAWCDANPRDPDAAEFRTRIDRWAHAYARWGRDTMGYALLLLQRD